MEEFVDQNIKYCYDGIRG